MCGGAAADANPDQGALGRSPRVRGSPADAVAAAFSAGSIPACAGEPRAPSRCRGLPGVDPRVCGGAHRPRPALDIPGGRSPRVRGSQHLGHTVQSGVGSIPACAGEPRLSRHPRRIARVDPRVCGGAQSRRTRSGGIWGRSPRVRGSPIWRSAIPWLTRSIPACAGEPGLATGRHEAGEVDPRVCGGAAT